MSSKKLKVGILVVAGILLFAVGLFLIGSRKQLFSHKYSIFADFEDVNTIQPGAALRVSGMNAGTVKAVEIPKSPSAKFRVELDVDRKFQHIVRENSVASISTEGMVGNKFVEVDKGTDSSPECRPGCTIKTKEGGGMEALMKQGAQIGNEVQDTIKDLRSRADVAMKNITDLTAHADRTIVAVQPNVERVVSNAATISGDSKQLVAGVKSGQGTVGKLLVDQQTAKDATDTVANAKQITTNIDQASEKANDMVSEVQRKDLAAVHETLDNAKDMTSQLDQATGTFLSKGNTNENTAEALRSAVHGAQQTTSNLADDTEAIKHNFFLRGFFKRRGFYNLDTITPSKYASSEFVKKPHARVWIPAAGLFKVGSDGSQELSDVGRTILDRSMSDLVPYLPNNPIVVEGYSTNGMPDQRYLASRQRAIQVRGYLESRFHLNSKLVGVMPLGDHPPAGVHKSTWDGICLALVVSKK